MSFLERLHLDKVVTSFPELGPTAPDGGYSWFVLFGIIFIQITVPSILSMYGTVLGYLVHSSDALPHFDMWSEKITLTPILFVAFWCLADPWTKTITDLASIPRLVGLIGVILLSTGVIASGYLATGGVGAYLASLSAGAVMGIGASFVIIQSETVLRKHFRVKLPLALMLKNIAASVGFTIVPALMYFLLVETDLKTGLLLMTVVFVPTALGTLTLRSPPPQRASCYRLLLSTEEDNELGNLFSNRETESEQRNNGEDNVGYVDNVYSDKQDKNPVPLFSEVNSMYSYQDVDEDIELFISPILKMTDKWKQELYVVRYFRFWVAAITWIGVRAGILFFWILVPVLFLKQSEVDYYTDDWATLLVIAGIGSFVPSIVNRWLIVTSAQGRKIYFGIACCASGGVLIGLTYANTYYLFVTYSLIGGVCFNSLLTCQDLTLCDVLGNQFAYYSRRLFSTFVGFGVMIFSFVPNEYICLFVIALLLISGGFYYTVPAMWNIIQAWRRRNA